MPLSGPYHRLSTNPRSSSRRSAGYSVPSFRSKNPFDRSRSSRRIWNPYFSSEARRASRHSWIEPFFSSAVHSGEISGIPFASYPTLAISAFGRGVRAVPRVDRHRPPYLQGSRSSEKRNEKKGEGGAQSLRLAFDRRHSAGPMARPTTASWAARIVTGVRFTLEGRSTSDSVDITGSWTISCPAG